MVEEKLKELIKFFDSANSILVVSSYPERGVKYSGKVCALGGFTKNTLLALKNEFIKSGQEKKIVVLTLKTTDQQEIYKEEDILIVRCFQRNNPFSYFSLLKAIFLFKKSKHILVEFEFSSFGDTFTTCFFPVFLMVSRLLGKKITLVLHQVIFDLNQILGHTGLERDTFKTLFLEKMLGVFYHLLCLPAEEIIVLEEELKKRLSKIVDSEKIIVIPHGVDRGLKLVEKKTARKRLGLKRDKKVLLYFGYLTWYKGIDWLIKNVPGENFNLVVAGGPSFSQKDKPHYQKFLNKTYSLAHKRKIKISGFLPEELISLYFSAADLVILPYRTFMSSSGPLSLSLTFKKPFLVSKPLAKIFDSFDFQIALIETGLTKENLIFNLEDNSLRERLKDFEHLEKKLSLFSRLMSKKRNFQKTSTALATILNKKENCLSASDKRPLLSLSPHPEILRTN